MKNANLYRLALFRPNLQWECSVTHNLFVGQGLSELRDASREIGRRITETCGLNHSARKSHGDNQKRCRHVWTSTICRGVMKPSRSTSKLQAHLSRRWQNWFCPILACNVETLAHNVACKKAYTALRVIDRRRKSSSRKVLRNS